MNLRCLITAFILLSFIFPTEAARYTRNATVKQLHPIANERPGAGGQNLIRIYVNQASWGESNCRTDAADMKKEDTHLYSTLLWAMSSGKSIRIEVADELKPYDTVCQVTALFVQ